MISKPARKKGTPKTVPVSPSEKTAFWQRPRSHRQRRRLEKQHTPVIPVKPPAKSKDNYLSRFWKAKPRPTAVMAPKGQPPKSPSPKFMAKKPQVSPIATPRKRVRSNPMARSVMHGVRLLILGVGIGALAGTLLSVLDPANRITAVTSSTSAAAENQQPTPQATAAPSVVLTQEITPLKTAVQDIAAKTPLLTPGVFLLDVNTGSYVDVNGAESFASASMIKFPVLVALFQDLDAGKISLEESLTVDKAVLASGSGDLQYKGAGVQLSVLDTAIKMITISDNTATNMLIAKLGGADALNQRFNDWGLTTTAIHKPLPDIEGTNSTSPKDLANLMAWVSQGKLVSLQSRDRLLDIMRRTVRDNLLPSGLGPGAIIAHKTGDIGAMLGDVGLVDLPSGKRYIAVVMVKRPHDDPRAQQLIRSISIAAYQQFNQGVANPINPQYGQPTPPTGNTGYIPYSSPSLPMRPSSTGYPPYNSSPPIPPTGTTGYPAYRYPSTINPTSYPAPNGSLYQR